MVSPSIHTYPWQYSVREGVFLELKHTYNVVTTNGAVQGLQR